MSCGDRHEEVMVRMRRKAKVLPLLMVVSMSAVVCAAAACASMRFVAGSILPVVRMNALFFLVLAGSAIASFLFFVSTRAVLRRVLRLVADVVGEKDVLVDNVLHDLKSAVTNISCNAQLMMSGDRDMRTAGEGILSSCDRLFGMIDDNIAITNNTMGLGVRRRDPVDVARLVSDIVAESGDAAMSRGVVLSCDVPQDGLPVFADLSKLDALVCNLVDNAIKYTPTGGKVEVSIKAVDKGFELKVSDTGVGMTDEVQSRMYERFYRADMSSKEKGSGLGLAMVMSVVKFYGGKILCKSAPAEGTTFLVSLPLSR